MKRIAETLFVTLWLCMLLAIGLYYIFSADSYSVYSESEKRMLSEAPKLNAETILTSSLSEQTESFLTDRFFLRRELINASNAIRDLASVATYEEYLAIMEEPEDLLVENETLDENTQKLLDEMLSEKDEPAPDIEPVSTTEPSAQPAQDADASQTFVPSVTEPIPVVVPKPEADENDFPTAMGIYMSDANGNKQLASFTRDYVIANSVALNKYAELLPEDGRLIFTVVPQSSNANRYLAHEEHESFYTDFEDCVNAFGADNVFAISAGNILGEAMNAGEYVYFRTDMHWTPYGTYLVYCDMVKQAGLQPAEYSDFDIDVEEPFLGTYYRDNPSGYLRDNADMLELLKPQFELEWRRICGKDEYKLIDFLDYNASSGDRYTVYLGGPAGPWTYAECDNGKTENCLVLCDSFGLAFVPMVTQNYKQVHYCDPRYYNSSVTGCSISEMIAQYDITDIYVVVGDLHSFNSNFIIGYAVNYLF